MTSQHPEPVGEGKSILVGPVRYSELCPDGRKLLLDAGFTLIENPSERPYTFEDMLPYLGNIHAAVAGVELWNEQVFKLAPELRAIGRLGVGLDNVDLEAAAANGTYVSNVPGGNANAVAELAVGLLISLQRKIAVMDKDIRGGRWDRYTGSELTGKTLGLVGFGAIAQLVAKRMAGFDVRIVASDPYPNAEAAARLGVEIVPFEEVLASADLLSVHAPHTEETHHLINEDALSLMQPHAVLVNTSRGGLVDEKALYLALELGTIAGAALDVWEHEPVSPDNPLLGLKTVLATTHAAADTIEAYRTVGLATAQAIIDVFSGRDPQNLRNRPRSIAR
jgi:D-3-phosphoglycerate dehydrogenase / 2-oxoglutarate reductase